MRAWIITLAASASLLASAADARPLTPAEQRVCKSLSHCLSIVERHPQDSFDYGALVEEFARFGPKGRKALIRMMESGKAEAGHAADLIALSADRDALLPLGQLAGRSDGKTKALALRTREAVARRLRPPVPRKTKPAFMARSVPTGCRVGKAAPYAARAREMPYFESDVASPDAYGAYRPSATFRVNQDNITRGHLRSATSVRGGWLAGYDGGLVFYDNKTGAPTVLETTPIAAVAPFAPGALSTRVWAISTSAERTTVLDASPPKTKIVATLPGPIAGMRRADDGTLLVTVVKGNTIRLRPDGTLASGCQEKRS